MKKLILLPTAIFPWLVCAFLAAFSLKWMIVMDHVEMFECALLVAFFLAVVCNIVYMVLSKGEDSDQVVKEALLLKVCHIIPYALIFLVGLMMAPMFYFTMPVILLFVLLDLCFLWLGNMISIFALIKAIRRGGSKGLNVVALICQFFFCADIISLFALDLMRRAARAVM